MARNQVMQDVKQFIRQPFAFPGGYPKALYMADGETLCPACAKDHYRLVSHATRFQDRHSGWRAHGVDLHLEGEPLVCSHCSKETESAYGIPGND